ncbi:integrase family protein (plasmid) [Halorubrum lacusprofundi ATCC 49239]|jgi:integrase|uniref:Integrase family protein n=1 Tax=Halorubrum lacusprofundi (strain ATCC 49239 / DSM 5036 / JCM 8891 / ACAM 34) TaxID=416348 RepID=B9LXB6_HALLT|nr:site-specific integrase [Halorubrum lacusprofundi]ACM59107.1 integrase family protein [Halorubrum lacusprofundi ATCC 49239]
MQLESYEEDDGFRVSLTKEEREALYDEIDNTTSSIAWGLASYCGLRRQEIGDVQFKDLRRRDNGDYVLRVWEGKGDKYRETPVPSSLAIRIQTVEETSDVDSSDEVIDHSMRTCIRHVQAAADRIQDETGDEGWQYLGLHDGRRTFCNTLLDSDVGPLQVMQWASFDDWKTFKKHYLTSVPHKASSASCFCGLSSVSKRLY